MTSAAMRASRNPSARRLVLTAWAACLAFAAVGFADVPDDVARAFRGSSARAIRGFLPTEGHVYIALSVLEVEEGFVGSDQLYYLLDGLFERATTVAFDLTSTDRSDSESIFLRARWTLEDSDGREQVVRLSMTLSRNRGGWFIRELRGGRG